MGRGRHKKIADLELRILRYISTEPFVFHSDILESVKGIKSKGALSRYLKRLCEENYIEKRRRAFRITERGFYHLTALEEIERKIGEIKPFLIRAYLIENDLSIDELNKLDQFVEELKIRGFGEVVPYEFGGREDQWVKAKCLIGHGPFNFRRENEIPKIEVHVSKVMLLIQVYPSKESASHLRDIFRGEIVDALRDYLNATWRCVLTTLYEVFGKKIKLKPIPLERWMSLGMRDKLGPTAPKSRL